MPKICYSFKLKEKKILSCPRNLPQLTIIITSNVSGAPLTNA